MNFNEISTAEKQYFSFLDEWEMEYYYAYNISYYIGNYDVGCDSQYCQPENFPAYNIRYSLVTKRRYGGGVYTMWLVREIGPYDEYLFPL
jgi:hypothetical protein